MRIAIPVTGMTPDDPCDELFGRANRFCLIDPETLEWSLHENPARDASGGAGVQAAQLLADLNADVVLGGSFGPNAFDALEAAGIRMFLIPTGKKITGREALQSYQSGNLKPVNAPSHAGHRGGRGGRRGRA
ncbi:MAG: NifB/NifX family molybdenum-iron cluster-binding protein [Anaerolineales bacterium]|jgi:predicted Fe-Mo cluster-binding NifX family protein